MNDLLSLLKTAKLDEFITEANSASGLGSKGNSYIVFNGKKFESNFMIILFLT